MRYYCTLEELDLAHVKKDFVFHWFIHSPSAYSIINQINWLSEVAKHARAESVWRYLLQTAYVIFGRELVRSNLYVNAINISRRRPDIGMGPVSQHSLEIAIVLV